MKYLLLSGAVYFFAVSIVHFLGFKLPPLFIYYDVDSFVYQDRIISALSAAFAVFLFAGYKIVDRSPEIVKYIIAGGGLALAGIAFNNFFTRGDFRSNLIYWIEIGFLALYLVSLFVFYSKNKR